MTDIKVGDRGDRGQTPVSFAVVSGNGRMYYWDIERRLDIRRK